MNEAEKIAAWLRSEAAEYEPGGSFGKVVCAALHNAANAIERGDHLQEQSK